MAIAQMKVCLGEWTQEEIDFNRGSILEKVKSLNATDIDVLRSPLDFGSAGILQKYPLRTHGVQYNLNMYTHVYIN